MLLKELVDNSRTDKNTVHAYLELYQKLVENKKDSAKNILEIGIGGGGSIQLWNDFFLNADIYSIDITPMNWFFEKLLPLDRVTLYTGVDAYDEKIFNSYFYKKKLKFDMILDDGAHTLETMIKFVELYSKILTDDGILIIEDIPDMNWTEILKQHTPEHLKKFIDIYDLRNIKDRFDDIVFVIDKTKKNIEESKQNIEILINNNVLDNFIMKNSEYLYHQDCYHEKSGNQEYRLYSYISTFLNNTKILDIGTSYGRSAIALSHNESNNVISYDIVNHINDNNHKIYSKQNVEFRIKDVLDDLNEEFLKNCKLVIIDIDHYEIIERKIIDKLIECNFSGIVILDDIHHPQQDMNEAMQRLWKSINIPKFDITKYAHWSGTGLLLVNTDNIHLIFKNENVSVLEYLSRKYVLDKNIFTMCHNYIPSYERLFENKRYQTKNLLEIGIGSVENGQMSGVVNLGYKTGNSLKCWSEYFPNAKIYGIDIYQHKELNSDKITTFVADQSNEKELQNVMDNINNELDIIIDDGSHNGEHQKMSFMILEKYLSKNGIYVIEDIQPAYINKFIDLTIFPNFFNKYIKEKYEIKYFDTRECLNRADDFMVAFIKK
jgi:predicted O-methyltransferase YrrM